MLLMWLYINETKNKQKKEHLQGQASLSILNDIPSPSCSHSQATLAWTRSFISPFSLLPQGLLHLLFLLPKQPFPLSLQVNTYSFKS